MNISPGQVWTILQTAVWGFINDNALSRALASLLVSAALSGLSDYAHLPLGTWILSAINTIISLVLIALLFGAIYKVLPDRSLSWLDVGVGAIVTAIPFTVGKSLIRWYLGTSAVASSYGLREA